MPPFTTRKTFSEVPSWLNVFSGHAVSINSPQLHYYTTRTQQDQPVTLHVTSNQHQHTQIHMFYSIERASPYAVKTQEDISGLKEYAVEQEVIGEDVVLDRQTLKVGSCWVMKYEPRRFIDLLSDEMVNRNVLTWLKSWDQIVFKKKSKNQNVHTFFKKNNTKLFANPYPQQQYSYKKFILLAGPPGCGKTTLARVLAKHSGYSCEEINASDDRSGKVLITKIQNFLTNKTIKAHQKPVCLVIDEVDGALDSQANGMKNLLNYLERGSVEGGKGETVEKPEKQQRSLVRRRQQKNQKQNKWNNGKRQKIGRQSVVGKQQQKRRIQRPIIFICNDPFVKGLRQLRSKAIVVYMSPVSEQRIVRRLKEISELEQVYIDSESLSHLSKICGRDIRSSIGLLQLVVKAMRESGLSAKQVMQKMKVTMSKDATQNNNDFLLQLINENQKNKTPFFQSIHRYTSSHDALSLLLTTFHYNLLNNKQIFLKMHSLTALYQQICLLDSHNSHLHLSENSYTNMLPFIFYKLHIPADTIKRIQFPMAYFQHFNAHVHVILLQKHKQALLTTIKKNIPTNLSVFISLKTMVLQYAYLLWNTMQTNSNREDQILKCVYKMLIYKFKLAPTHSTHLFTPDLGSLLNFASHKPQVVLSTTSRNLIQEHYEFLSLKYDLLSEVLEGSQKQNLQCVVNELKKNRRRKRNYQSGDIKYKYLEGTGTQIKYDLKLRYFFEDGVSSQ